MFDLDHSILGILLRLVSYMMIVSGAQTRFFQGRGGFLEQGHFNKHFIFDTREKDRTGKNIFNVLKLFLLW